MIEFAAHLERAGFSLAAEFRAGAPVVGLFGASGAGKTSVVSAIAGLLRPSRGVVRVDGVTLLDTDAGVDVPVHERRVGVVFQEHRLFPHLSVESNLRYGMRATPEAEFERTVDVLEIGSLLGRRPSELSGGEKQRVAIGRALLASPKLLLLDEPLASLDVRLKSQLLRYLRRVLVECRTPAVYVSHDLSEILSLTSELVVMDAGRVVGQGGYAGLVHESGALRVLHASGMTNVVAARVGEPREGEHAPVFVVGEGGESRRIVAPHAGAGSGRGAGGAAEVRLIVRPADIALAAGPLEKVSIQNQLQGIVRRVSVHEQGVMVEVEAGAAWIVEVSRRAAQELALEPGRGVVCLIKSHAIRVE